MIIFDWDDTLLCTTFLGSLGFIDLDQQILDQLKPLDDSAVKILIDLTLIFSYFNICIYFLYRYFDLSFFIICVYKLLFYHFLIFVSDITLIYV